MTRKKIRNNDEISRFTSLNVIKQYWVATERKSSRVYGDRNRRAYLRIPETCFGLPFELRLRYLDTHHSCQPCIRHKSTSMDKMEIQ